MIASRLSKVQWICVLVFSIVCVLLISFFSSIKDQLDYFSHALTQGEFYLEGELVYWGKRETTRNEIIEFHKDGNYQIIYPNRIFQFLDGHYYVYDERSESSRNGNQILISDQEEMQEIQEMFDQTSVVSGCGLSNAESVSNSYCKIPERTGNGNVVCNCRIYLLKDENNDDQQDEPKVVRLYFLDNKLYAISTWNENLLFYISKFSDISPQIKGVWN